MGEISVIDICDRYDMVKITVQRAFQTDRLLGRKDARGRWVAKEKDAEDLFKKLDPREWLHIDYCTKYSPYSRAEILEAVDDGRLEAKENFWGKHIHYEKWSKNMSKACCDNEKCAQIKDGLNITIVNKCGIHNRPTALIGRIMMNHPLVELYLC